MTGHSIATRRIVLGLGLGLPLALARRPAAAVEDGLVGAWCATQDGVEFELALMPDGRFRRQERMTDGTAAMTAGTWRLIETPGTLRLDIQDWAPRRLCDALGCSDIRMAAVESYRFAFPAADTLLLQSGAGRFAFRRTG